MTTTHRLLFVFGAGLAIAPAQVINADTTTFSNNVPINNVLISTCTGSDASMTVGKTAQGYYFDHRTSNGTTYTAGCNSAYVVDVIVPGSYKIDGIGKAISIGGGFDSLPWSQLNQYNCDNATESVQIYKWTGSWQLINSQNVQGTWVPFLDMGIQPLCALSSPIRVLPPSFSYLTDVYRVMVRPKLYGNPVQARVSWTWTY